MIEVLPAARLPGGRPVGRRTASRLSGRSSGTCRPANPRAKPRARRRARARGRSGGIPGTVAAEARLIGVVFSGPARALAARKNGPSPARSLDWGRPTGSLAPGRNPGGPEARRAPGRRSIGPYIRSTSTTRLPCSRTPSAVGTSGSVSPTAFQVMRARGTPASVIVWMTTRARRSDRPWL